MFAFRESILILVLLVGGIIMTAASPVFLTWPNLEAILLGLSVEGTIAVGMVILLVSGGLDLSVGSTLAFTGVVCGLALTRRGAVGARDPARPAWRPSRWGW